MNSGLVSFLHANSGLCYLALGLMGTIEAEKDAQDSPEALNERALALEAAGRMQEAIATYQAAIELRPNFSEAWTNLGTALHSCGLIDEAHAAHLSAVANLRAPNAQDQPGGTLSQLGSVVHNNLGTVLRDLGRFEEAIAAFRAAIDLWPDPRIHGNLLLALNYCEKATAQDLKREHLRFAELYERPLLASHRPHDVTRDPDRRLRIGYVSPDFHDHPVGLFIEPILAHHDRAQFEVCCYSTSGISDALTQRLRSMVDRWMDVQHLSDDQVAELIRRDKVDILIDLSGHTAMNRLLIFARRPAPVQVTYLGYPDITGLQSIQYTLSSEDLDAIEISRDEELTEFSRLPNGYCCYQPRHQSPDVTPLPARDNGFVTFGCLNNIGKAGPRVLEAWVKILTRVARSRLLLYSPPSARRDHVKSFFVERGIAPQRIEFVGKESIEAHLRTIGRVDIALDPFPYNGGTTTLNSLWMGVPVITFAGQRSISRAGYALLTAAGFDEFIAKDIDGYIDLACETASDLGKLSEIRASLRPRMARSPLCDAQAVTRGLEQTLRRFWRRWCQTG